MATMPLVPAHRKPLFRREAAWVGATVARVMFVEVALGMAAPTARLWRLLTTGGPTMTMPSRHNAGRLCAAASGQGMVVVVGLTTWRSTSVALTEVAALPTAAPSETLVVGVEPSVTAATETAALGLPVITVRL